jgi:hypothetical protein
VEEIRLLMRAWSKDEILVAMYVEDVLDELGYEVVALATELDQALPAARREEFGRKRADEGRTLPLRGRQKPCNRPPFSLDNPPSALVAA